MTDIRDIEITEVAGPDIMYHVGPREGDSLCFKVELSPGVFEGPNFSKTDESKARIYRTKGAAQQSAAVKHRHGTIVECVVIPTSRLRELEELESLEMSGAMAAADVEAQITEMMSDDE